MVYLNPTAAILILIYVKIKYISKMYKYNGNSSI